ncbi:MAG: FAD-dependent hydroxylase [Cyanobacteria bacterium P01_H01_bin.121]
MALDVLAKTQLPSAPQTTKADVVIVGAGIVGVVLACSLAQAGLEVALVETRPKTAGLENRRAYALTLLTGDILQQLGVWDQLVGQVTAFQQIRLSEAAAGPVVRLQPSDLQRQSLGYVAEHRVVLQALYDRLDKLDTVHWCCPATVTAVDYKRDQAVVTVTTEAGDLQIAAPLVVAADGMRSPLRQAAAIKTQGWSYWQSCISFTIQLEHSHQAIAHECFWPSGPFAILPLPSNRCQIVWTAPHAEAQAIAALPETEFIATLQARLRGQFGAIQLETQPLVFPVRLMQSRHYSQPRLALIGDAAHCCHPVGGQGMNMGIRDAAALAQILTTAAQQSEDWGSLNVLRRYERWRRLENLAILGFTDILTRTFSNQIWPLTLFRRWGLSLLNICRPLRVLALRLMTGQLGRSPL